MPEYLYTSVDASGQHTSGSMSAKDEQDLSRALREKGLVVTSVREKHRASAFSSQDIFGGIFGVSLEEKLMFIRNLRVMVTAGVPLPKSLGILSQQAKSGLLRISLQEMQEKVTQGSALSDAMKAYPKVFSDLFVSMVKVGEESGTMENVLAQLGLQMDREYDLKSKIKSALMYPAVVVVAMIGIGIIMLAVVVPKLAATFKDVGTALPLSTRFVMGLGEALSERWYVVLGVMGILLFGVRQFLKTKTGKESFDTLTLKIPFISTIVQKTNAAFTVRILSSLIAAGVPIVRSLEITGNVLGNVYFKRVLEKAAEDVRKGAKLSQVFRQYGSIYPLVVTQMIEVGEETGKTSEVLAKLADFYEEEVNALTKNIASIVEPVLMLLIGGVVGFFAISMIQPMYSMMSSLKQ